MDAVSNVKLKRLVGKKKIRRGKISETLISYAMLSTQITGFLIFTIYPILWVYRYSLYDYDGVREIFIGFNNFVRIFARDELYWKSLVNTFIIAYGKLIIELPLALVL